MKVAVSSNGENLDAQLDPRFGRCQFFLVVNPDDMSFEACNNESAAQGGGAGIQAAQFLASQGVEAVITGNCGPNAVQTLSAAGIELFVGQTGTVKEVVERLKKGKFKLPKSGNYLRSFAHVEDVASALVAIGEKNETNSFNFPNSSNYHCFCSCRFLRSHG